MNVDTGLTESLFSSHKDEYLEHEQASLRQLYQAKVCNDNVLVDQIYHIHIANATDIVQMGELRAESQQLSESTGTIGRSKGASLASSQQQISVTVVTEFVHWNEEAISRCALFSSQVMFSFFHHLQWPSFFFFFFFQFFMYGN